jgi:hypothetical protein
MRLFVRLVLVCLIALASSGFARAADISALSWGDFITLESSDGVASKFDMKADGKLSASMIIEGLAANADGEKTEGSSTFTGQFLVAQPGRAELGAFRAEVTGLIVKTTGASARADIQLGSFSKTIEWPEDGVNAQRFTNEITGVFNAGRLPSPFVVSAILLVKKPADKGSVLLTVDKITMEAAPALVGQIQRPTVNALSALENPTADTIRQ